MPRTEVPSQLRRDQPLQVAREQRYRRSIVMPMARGPRAAHRWRSASLLVAVVIGALLLLSSTGSDRSAGTTPASTRTAGSPYTLMQMNLCLSGLAGCYGRVAYPGVVREAVARIRDAHPDAVTFNEACQRDVARIAGRTGYHLRFTRVIYLGAPLLCIQPGGRGLFGDAVLTRAAVETSRSRDFEAQSDIERRRWLCVATRIGVDVCTAHLSTRDTRTTSATNDAQCAELSTLLRRRATVHTVVFGGDLNRHGSCAPGGFWTRTDSSADQARGLQHVYGSSGTLRWPSTEVVAARHSDHDVLLVRSRLVRTSDRSPRAAGGVRAVTLLWLRG
jgi:endonuclease/exonuclease/phosphatase family metal-dependent hydrolase